MSSFSRVILKCSRVQRKLRPSHLPCLTSPRYLSLVMAWLQTTFPRILSNELPPGLSDDDLREPATRKINTPFTFVSATDAIAKDRAGRRDRPVSRHPGPSQVDDRQDPSVSSQSILFSHLAYIVFVKIELRVVSHFMQRILTNL